jgi:hypothetical protein
MKIGQGAGLALNDFVLDVLWKNMAAGTVNGGRRERLLPHDQHVRRREGRHRVQTEQDHRRRVGPLGDESA